jgi:IS30 family transposase
MPKGYSHVTRDQRNQIYALKSIGLSLRAIAKRLGLDASTVCRELQRNALPLGGYNVDFADNAAKERQAKVRRVPKKMKGALKNFVLEGLEKGWSPEECCGRLKLEKSQKIVSHETIYRFVRRDRQQNGTLYKFLRHKGKQYRYKAKKDAGVSLIPNRVDISERPDIVEKKSRIGDWEGDTIISAGSRAAVITLVDRLSKYTCIAKLGRKKAKKTMEAAVRLLQNLAPVREISGFLGSITIPENPTAPEKPVHTITYDNGLEFSEHEEMAEALGAKVFFARPYCSCDRGLNEHTNGLIREYLPKHEDFREVSEEKIQDIMVTLNTRPRKSLGFLTPDEVFFSYEIRFF